MTFTLSVVVDTHCLLHRLYELSKSCPPAHVPGAIRANIAVIMNGSILSTLGETTRVIFIGDSKPYWRDDYLKDPEVLERVQAYQREHNKKVIEAIHYKGGRKLPTAEFNRFKRLFFKIVKESGAPYLVHKNYEADDIAAAIKVLAPYDTHLVYLTVDSDWLGLLGGHTSWYCMHGYLPRHRYDMDTLNEWARRRLKTVLMEPREIWDIKARQGDRSDNLPVGTPIEVIDLINPPKEHQLWRHSTVRDRILSWYNSTNTWDVDPAAHTYLGALGMFGVTP